MSPTAMAPLEKARQKVHSAGICESCGAWTERREYHAPTTWELCRACMGRYITAANARNRQERAEMGYARS